MALDHKYTGIIRKADTGELVSDEEWIVFRAKDNAVPTMLMHYHAICQEIGSPPEHLDAVHALLERVLLWRMKHGLQCKAPD